MNETPDAVTTPAVEPSSATPTAGSLLRDARLAKGLHIAVLATAIKVTPRKLEALEADRYDELPGAAFTRGLAQSVCRTLKMDPAPVLALLPHALDQGLSHMSAGLNAPFRDKPGRHVPRDFAWLKSPMRIAAVVLVLASIVVYLMPAGWISDLTRASSSTPALSPTAPTGETSTLPPESVAGAEVSVTPAAAPSVPVLPQPSLSPAATAVVSTTVPVSAAEGQVPSVAASAAVVPSVASAVVGGVAPLPAGVLQLHAVSGSWVEVIDARGTVLLSRLLSAGETVGLDGPTPLRVKIGNAAGTQVMFQGRAVSLDLARDNVARLELR